MRLRQIRILVMALALMCCERDDICAESTATTPRLIIEFYDSSNTEDLKNVSRLTVYGEGLVLDENGIAIEPTEVSDATIVFDENSNAVELPLIIDAEGEVTTARFVFESNTNLRLDDDTSTNSNIDIIEFSYTSQFIYVSRACGYKSIFTNLDDALEIDTNNWISNVDVEEIIIANENTLHVRIFH